jgi:hypothetical protein
LVDNWKAFFSWVNGLESSFRLNGMMFAIFFRESKYHRLQMEFKDDEESVFQHSVF